MSQLAPNLRGPFTADQIRPGEPLELSNGHAIQCMGTGGRGSDAKAVGAVVLKSDPDVLEAGVDTGFTPEPGILRAPDVAVGNVPKKPGWVQGVPSLAVEYADTGQDEADLDWDVGSKITLRNLLQRQGYDSLDAVLEEGIERGRTEALRHNVEDLCELLDIELTTTRRDVLTGANVEELEKLRQEIKRERRWKEEKASGR